MKTTSNGLIPEAIKKAFFDSMDENYTLIDTGDINYYEEDPKSIQSCLDQKSSLPIDDNQWQADSRYQGSLYQLEELERKILKNVEYKDVHPFIADWLADEENELLIIDAIEEKDISKPIKEMLARTKLRGRATLYTNYVFMSSNSDLKNTYEYDEYLKDIVDLLCLNPAGIKTSHQTASGIDKNINYICEFDWVDKKYPETVKLLKSDLEVYGLNIPSDYLILTLRLQFVYDDSGSCRDIYQGPKGGAKYCRLWEQRDNVCYSSWFTVTEDWEEPCHPLRTDILIQILDKDINVVVTEQNQNINGEFLSEKTFPFSWEHSGKEENLCKSIYEFNH